MKKLLFGIAILLLLGYGWNALKSAGSEENKVVVREGTAAAWEGAESEEPGAGRQMMLKIDPGEIYKGDLLLINSRHPVPKGAKLPDVVNLFERPELAEGIGILDDSVELPPELLSRFVEMIKAAETDGVDRFLITSGYRSVEKQAELYDKMGADYANPPGHSEHNLGLALDVGSALGLMKEAPEGKWLERNAWKYGFVLRYPENKTEITGVKHEPWHFRYVGLPHSAIMQKMDFVLEEYVDYLKEQGQIQAKVDGTAYVVSYYAVKGKRSLSIPIAGSYFLSGNNMDGVIVTTWGSDASGAKEVVPL